jgi:hypothetical protein
MMLKNMRATAELITRLADQIGDLAATAVISADALDRAANRLIVHDELELAAEMRSHAERLRRTAEAARG